MNIELTPKLLTGRLVNITDINAVIELKGRMGMVHLPLRSFFADRAMALGDEVEIFGKNKPIEILANVCQTIPYEILCRISTRIKRLYTQG